MESLLIIRKLDSVNQKNIVDCNSKNFPIQIILTFNGESNNISFSILQAKKLIPKTLKFIRKKQNPLKDQKIYKEQFLATKEYIGQLLNFFEQTEQEEKQQLLDKQMIFYKMSGLQILNDIFIDLNSIRDYENDILIMYNNIIAIYYYLTKKNLIISQDLSKLNYAKKLLSCLFINIGEKITIHKVFSNILYNNEFQYQLIELIFEHVKQIGAELLMKHSFFLQYAEHIFYNQKSSQENLNYSCDIQIKAAVECVKILSAIAKIIVPNKYRYLERQEFIISKILSSNFFCISMTPQNYFTKQNDEMIQNLEPHLIDLHKSILYLSCYCCQNNPSATLELKRIIRIDYYYLANKLVYIKNIAYAMRQAYFKYIFTQLKQYNINGTEIESLQQLLIQLILNEFERIFGQHQIEQKEFQKFFSKQGVFSMWIGYLSFLPLNNENKQKCEQLFHLIDSFLLRFQDIPPQFEKLLEIYEHLRKCLSFFSFREYFFHIQNHFKLNSFNMKLILNNFVFFILLKIRWIQKNFLANFVISNSILMKLVKRNQTKLHVLIFQGIIEQSKSQVAASQYFLQNQSEKPQIEQELKQSLHSFLINSQDIDIKFLHKVLQYQNQHNSIELQVNIAHFISNNSSIQQTFIQLVRQQLISSKSEQEQQKQWKEIMKFISKLCNANKEFQDLFQIGHDEAISIQNIIINKQSLFLTKYQEEKRYLEEIIEGLIALQNLAARNSTICQEICRNQLFIDQLNKILGFQDLKNNRPDIDIFLSGEFTLIFQIVTLFIVLINVEQPFLNIILILNQVQNLRTLFQVFFESKINLLVERYKESMLDDVLDQPERLKKSSNLYSNLFTLYSYLKYHLASMSNEQNFSEMNIGQLPSIADNTIIILNIIKFIILIRIKQHILTHIDRSNQYKRIQGLIKNFDTYRQQMQFLRDISKYKLMYLGLRNWRILKKITYFFYLLVAFYNEEESVSLEQNLTNYLNENNQNEIYYTINSLILFLNCIIFGFSFIERNKILVADYKSYREQRVRQIQYQKFDTKLDFYFSDLSITIFQFFSRFNNCFVEILPVILNFENIYNILIISLVIYGYFNPYIYGILLLDIVNQSDDLQLIIQSVTLNGMNILRFAYLAVVGLLIYSFIAYSYFKSMFENENGIYANSLFQTITSTINLGLRSGGGIGDALGNYHNPNEDPSNYWSRYIYDVSFFIIFNMLFFQMLFGMIIETFGELRAEQQRIKQEINEKCVLCGISQDDADKYEIDGWFYHIYSKHNLYNMLFYMMHIKNKLKEQDQSNILEKYVFECITKQNPSFSPIIDSELKQQFQEGFINR